MNECRVLNCESEPTCCALYAERFHVAIVGTRSGSILLYDMRQVSNNSWTKGTLLFGPLFHTFTEINGQKITVREPTYTTFSLFTENHKAPLVLMCLLINANTTLV